MKTIESNRETVSKLYVENTINLATDSENTYAQRTDAIADLHEAWEKKIVSTEEAVRALKNISEYRQYENFIMSDEARVIEFARNALKKIFFKNR